MQCTHCGYELKRNAKECPACGTKQSAAGDALADEQKAKKDRKKNDTYKGNIGNNETKPFGGDTGKYGETNQPLRKILAHIDIARVTGYIFKKLDQVHLMMVYLVVAIIIFAVYLNLRDAVHGNFYTKLYYTFNAPPNSGLYKNKAAYICYLGIIKAYGHKPEELPISLDEENLMGWVTQTGTEENPMLTVGRLYFTPDTVLYTSYTVEGEYDKLEFTVTNLYQNNLSHQLLLKSLRRGNNTVRKFKTLLTPEFVKENELFNMGEALYADSVRFGNKELFTSYINVMLNNNYRRDTLILAPGVKDVAAVNIIKELEGYDSPSMLLLSGTGDNAVINEYELTGKPEDLKWVTLNNKLYLHYTYTLQGSGLTSLFYVLQEAYSTNNYALEMSRQNSGGRMFMPGETPENLKAEPVLLRYLEAEAAKHPFAYSESKATAPEMFADLWLNKNKNAVTALNEAEAPLNKTFLFFQYYSKNLFDVMGSTSEEARAENNKFTVIAYFKGPVLCYSKQTGKYFAAWVPADIYDFMSSVSLNGDILTVTRRDDKQVLTINLSTGAAERK